MKRRGPDSGPRRFACEAPTAHNLKDGSVHQQPVPPHRRTTLVNLATDDSGASAVEYGLIAGLVALAIVATAGLFGDDLAYLYEHSHQAVAAVVAAGTG